MSDQDFTNISEKWIDKLERSFKNLQKENDEGHLTIIRENLQNLEIKVENSGNYKFVTDL